MAGNKKFGQRLKELRIARGFNQEKLAELTNLEYQTISRIETGLYFTSYENLEKFAKVLGVNVKDLFDIEQDEISKKELTKDINSILYKLDIKNLKILYEFIKLLNTKIM